MSFRSEHKKIMEASISNKTAFQTVKNIDSMKKQLDKSKKDWDRVMNSLKSDKELYSEAHNVNNAFQDLLDIIEDFTDSVKLNM